MTVTRPLAVAACLSGALAVVIGAFAAHGAGPQVKALLTTGGHYLLTHAVFAVVCAALPLRGVVLAGWLALAGGLVFALSLSLIGLAGLPALGAVAPIGGLLMIAGWLVAAVSAWRARAASVSA